MSRGEEGDAHALIGEAGGLGVRVERGLEAWGRDSRRGGTARRRNGPNGGGVKGDPHVVG
jgi:hypothetical protein